MALFKAKKVSFSGRLREDLDKSYLNLQTRYQEVSLTLDPIKKRTLLSGYFKVKGEL